MCSRPRGWLHFRQLERAAQVETVSVALNAVTDERGNVVQPGYSVSELDGLVPEIVGLADPIHKVFVRGNDPAFKTATLFSFRAAGRDRPQDITPWSNRPMSRCHRRRARHRIARHGSGHAPPQGRWHQAADPAQLERRKTHALFLDQLVQVSVMVKRGI